VRRLIAVFALFACATATAEERVPLHDRYVDEVATIRAAAAENTVAYARLQTLCDDIGHRISGSDELERAIDWAEGLMREDGLVVTTEPVQVPKWVRGEESARVVVPYEKELEILGLGMTVAGEVKAEVVAVSSWEELEALDASAIEGRIVLFDVPFTTYEQTVQFRGKGPVEAAKRGAVAVLIRSVTPISLQTPHTGATRYDEGEEVPPIPAAALTIEDAAWIHRLLDTGSTVEVELKLSGEHHGMVPSRNLLGEIPGRELPDEVVVVGCHIDSWDVGQGAQDDGAGCLIAWEAVRLLHELDMTPRRTVRAVLFTNEENGLGGGRAYAEVHADEVHQALFESDTGNGLADGFRLDTSGLSTANALRVQGLSAELHQLLGGDQTLGYAGADIGPRIRAGSPGFGLAHDTATYWPIHHTHADTFEKIVLEDLQANIGMMAAAVWVVAEMEEPLALPEKKKKRRKK